MIRYLKRLGWLLLDVLPIALLSRALQRVRPSPVDIVFCLDVEADERVADRGDPAQWPSFERFTELLGEIRNRLTTLSGSPARFSWFVRMDPGVGEVWGSTTWPLEHYRETFAELEAHGDEIGLHMHSWRRDGETGQWVADRRPEWTTQCLTVALDSYEQALGRPCTAYRAGDRYLDGELLDLLGRRGVKVDVSIEPGGAPIGPLVEGEHVIGRLTSFAGVPKRPYRSSRDAFPAPDPSGGDPLLIPLVSAPEGGLWNKALMLPAHPDLFALRLLLELVRRPRVLAFVVRTDPPHTRVWPLVARNLEQLARHSGVRFVTASEAVASAAAWRGEHGADEHRREHSGRGRDHREGGVALGVAGQSRQPVERQPRDDG